MVYCPDCGVELDASATACPLCGAANPRHRAGSAVSEGVAAAADNAAEKVQSGESAAADASACADTGSSNHTGVLGASGSNVKFTPREEKKIAWEVISVASLVAAITLGAINLLEAGTLSWSLYPLASLAFVWLLSAAFLMFDRKPQIKYPLAALALPAFLTALDAVETGLSWSYEIAVPLALIVELVAALLFFAIAKTKRRGLNIVAYILIGVAAVCLGVEIAVDLFGGAGIRLGWSAIVALSIVPMACFLLYLHYRVMRTANLRRMFRL